MIEFWNFVANNIQYIVGPIVTLLSIIYNIWQYRQKRALEKNIGHKVRALFSHIDIILFSTQSAIKFYRGKGDPSVDMGGAERGTVTALVHCADIYCNLMKTSIDDIEEMVKNGMIRDEIAYMFKSTSVMKSGLLSKILKRLT